MSKVCQITGRKRMIGNNVAHSKLRTKRDFALNLKTKKFPQNIRWKRFLKTF